MSDEAYEKWHKNFLADDYNWLPRAPDLTRAAWDEATRQAQAVTVERVSANLLRDAHGAVTDTLVEVRGLLPDPNFLARKMAKARVEEAKWWDGMWQPSGDCGGRREQHIAELERDLATLGEGK